MEAIAEASITTENSEHEISERLSELESSFPAPGGLTGKQGHASPTATNPSSPSLLGTDFFKYSLTRIGRFFSPNAVRLLGTSTNYLEAGRWMHAHGHDVRHRVQRREELFDLVGRQVADREVLYMEFGVFCGDATRYWSKLLRNPGSSLHGFDTFEGLPEPWPDNSYPAGYFSTGGNIPHIDDPRVQFFKGLFEQTLPNYKCPPHDNLVLMMDADIYSATAFVLNALKDAIVPGTYLYFDEFHHRFDEMRAFDEFLRNTGWKFSLVGATRSLDCVMFQRSDAC